MTDPHAKRRQADGRNAWTKMGLTPGAREEFVRWMLENGLPEAKDALMRAIAQRMTKTVIDPLSGRPITYPDPDRKGTKAND